jgi:hypothetical protein
VLGQEHPSTLGSMINLALVLNSQDKYDKAEQMHQQTLELKKKVLGREHGATNHHAITWLELLDLIISCLEAGVTSVPRLEYNVSHENSQIVNIYIEYWNRGERAIFRVLEE